MEFGPHLMLAVLEGMVTAAILSLTAMGLSIVFGVMRVVNVAHGEFFMLGAVLAWFVSFWLGVTPAVGFIAGPGSAQTSRPTTARAVRRTK